MDIRDQAIQAQKEMGLEMLKYMEEKYGETFTLVDNNDTMATMYAQSHPHDLLKVTYFSGDSSYPLRDDYAGVFIREDLSARLKGYVDEYFPQNLTRAHVSSLSFHPSLKQDATYEQYVELHGWARVSIAIYVADIPAEERAEKICALADDLADAGFISTVYVRFVYPEMAERLQEPDIYYEIEENFTSRIPWYHETATLAVEKTDNGYVVDKAGIAFQELYTNR